MERNSRKSVGAWLVHCADPLGPRTTPPRRGLSPAEAADLVQQAGQHGVLGAVLQHFPPFRHGGDEFAAVKARAATSHRSACLYAAMLRQQGDELMAAADGLPIAIVKGPAFAHALYPAPRFRPFTDIDVLAAPSALAPLGTLLRARSFALAEADPAHREWKWLNRDDDRLMIEVQTDLVHAPSLRRTMSLTHDHIGAIADTPAARLAVAVVHGSLGSHFAKLGHVVDICQAARQLQTAEDERRFEDLVVRTGARLAAKTALALAGSLFDEPRCRAIAQALGAVRHARVARLLIGKSVVLSTTTTTRSVHAWRRQAFRRLLKQAPARADVDGP